MNKTTLAEPKIFIRQVTSFRGKLGLAPLHQEGCEFTKTLQWARDNALIIFHLVEGDDVDLQYRKDFAIEVTAIEVTNTTTKDEEQIINAYGHLVPLSHWYDPVNHELVTFTGERNAQKELSRVSAETREVLEWAHEGRPRFITKVFSHDDPPRYLYSWEAKKALHPVCRFERGELFQVIPWAGEEVEMWRRPAQSGPTPIDYLIKGKSGDLIVRVQEYFDPETKELLGEVVNATWRGDRLDAYKALYCQEKGNTRTADLRAGKRLPAPVVTTVLTTPPEEAEEVSEEPILGDDEEFVPPTPEEAGIIFQGGQPLLLTKGSLSNLSIFQAKTDDGEEVVQYLHGSRVIAEETREIFSLAREIGER